MSKADEPRGQASVACPLTRLPCEVRGAGLCVQEEEDLSSLEGVRMEDFDAFGGFEVQQPLTNGGEGGENTTLRG